VVLIYFLAITFVLVVATAIYFLFRKERRIAILFKDAPDLTQQGCRYRQIVFIQGNDLLPDNLMLSLSTIRKWALRNRLIKNPDRDIFNHTVSERLLDRIPNFKGPEIAIRVRKAPQGMSYSEHPYVSVGDLIKANEPIYLRWLLFGSFGDIRLGFRLRDLDVDVYSMTTGQVVTKKLRAAIEKLSSFGVRNIVDDDQVEIVLEQPVEIEFFKDGRKHDMKFTWPAT
jgi:hypothetical protein